MFRFWIMVTAQLLVFIYLQFLYHFCTIIIYNNFAMWDSFKTFTHGVPIHKAVIRVHSTTWAALCFDHRTQCLPSVPLITKVSETIGWPHAKWSIFPFGLHSNFLSSRQWMQLADHKEKGSLRMCVYVCMHSHTCVSVCVDSHEKISFAI